MAKTTQNHPTPRQPHLPTQLPRMHHHSNRNRPQTKPHHRRHQPSQQPPSSLHQLPQTKNTTRITNHTHTTQTQTQTTPTRHPHHQQNLTTPPPTTNNNTATNNRTGRPQGGYPPTRLPGPVEHRASICTGSPTFPNRPKWRYKAPYGVLQGLCGGLCVWGFLRGLDWLVGRFLVGGRAEVDAVCVSAGQVL